jgi:hypothetical protein
MARLSFNEENAYMETRKAVKELFLRVGINNITGHHANELRSHGHGTMEIQNAISYFRYSPQTAKYR